MELCFNPAGSLALHNCLLTPHSQWDGGKNEKKKIHSVELMGGGKNCLLTEEEEKKIMVMIIYIES